MGNLCGGRDEKRDELLRELFDLYDRDGGFNLGKEELIVLSKYLHDKEVMRLNEEIVALTIQLGKFEDTTAEHYVSHLVKSKKKIEHTDFKKLVKNVGAPELTQLLMEAKVIEYKRLQREVNMI
jgi:hypothetical protein